MKMFAEKLQFFYVSLHTKKKRNSFALYHCQLKDKLNFSKSTQENQSTIFFIQFVYGNPSFLLSQEKNINLPYIRKATPVSGGHFVQ